MANEFKPGVGGPVPKVDAQKWIKKYDDEHRPDKTKDTKSIFFGRDILLKLLEQKDCAGISFFLAKKHSDYAGKETVNLVLVGTREDGTLIWPAEGKDGGSGTTADAGTLCPPYCPTGG
jgi:hypothetical protein